MAQKSTANNVIAIRSLALAAMTASLPGCAPWLEGLARVPIVCAIGVQPVIEGNNIVFTPLLHNRGIGNSDRPFDIKYHVIGRTNSTGYTGAIINVPAFPLIIGTNGAPSVGAGPNFVVSPALLPAGARVPNSPVEYEITYEIDPTEAAFAGANRHCRYSGTIVYQGTDFVRVK